MLRTFCPNKRAIQQLQSRRMAKGPTSPLHAPTTPMTMFTGHTKGTTASESQIALNNFKKGTKRDAQLFPSSRMTSTMMLSRDLSWQPPKHKDYLMLLTQILIQMMEINVRSNSFWKNNHLCILSWLLLSKLAKEENWTSSLKEMQ